MGWHFSKKHENSSNFNQDFDIARGYWYRITGQSIDLNTTCELFFLAPVSHASDSSTSTWQRSSEKVLIIKLNVFSWVPAVTAIHVQYPFGAESPYMYSTPFGAESPVVLWREPPPDRRPGCQVASARSYKIFLFFFITEKCSCIHRTGKWEGDKSYMKVKITLLDIWRDSCIR